MFDAMNNKTKVLLLNFTSEDAKENNYNEISNFTEFEIVIMQYNDFVKNIEKLNSDRYLTVICAVYNFNDIILARNIKKFFSSLILLNPPLLLIKDGCDKSLRIAALQVRGFFCIFGQVSQYELHLYLIKFQEMLSGKTIYTKTIKYDKFSSTLQCDSRIKKIPSNMSKLLMYLSENKYTVVSRDDLFRLIYDKQWDPTDRRLDVLVNRLRNIFTIITNSSLEGSNIIRTERNVGYSLCIELDVFDSYLNNDSF